MHCCPDNALSLRDADGDVGGRATQGAVAVEARMRGYESGEWQFI
jgi:hypothetical protein